MLRALAQTTHVSYRMYHLLLDKVSTTTNGASLALASTVSAFVTHRTKSSCTCKLSHLWLHQAVMVGLAWAGVQHIVILKWHCYHLGLLNTVCKAQSSCAWTLKGLDGPSPWHSGALYPDWLSCRTGHSKTPHAAFDMKRSLEKSECLTSEKEHNRIRKQAVAQRQ